MLKRRLLVAMILVIGVIGSLFFCNSALFSGWMLMHPLEQDGRAHWNVWAWVMLAISALWLIGAWAAARWVWKLGRDEQSG